MITVESMRIARESVNVAFISFVNLVAAHKTGLFCFFEGKDSSYYSLRIKNVFDGSYHPIVCSGKNKVLKVYELIHKHKEYDKYKKGFFIDRDFDTTNSDEKIYETPCYSIENLYTSKSVFGEILKSELGFTEIDADYIKCVELYENLQQEYHRAATLFNAWYACLVQIKNTTQQSMEINLENSIPKKFISISLTGIQSHYNITDIQKEYPKVLLIDENIVLAKIKEFKIINVGKVFRGKFELNFMVNILSALILDAKQTKNYISKPLKYNVTETDTISKFSQYAETPQDLIEYINRISK